MDTVKYNLLQEYLKNHSPLIVAFSGGVDSSLLLFTAARTLGKERVLAVTARSGTFPKRELEESESFCRQHDIRHLVIDTDETEIINKDGNSIDRCYHCKRELFRELTVLAAREGFSAVAEGSNVDDATDYRPGRRAIAELGIVSPLKAAGLTKTEIRALARELGLAVWDKPSYACLTSRFPYHVEITPRALAMIEQGEDFLIKRGFRQCRVRHYDRQARIEVEKTKVNEALRQIDAIISFFKSIGYERVEIDPEGYRTGSMNVF